MLEAKINFPQLSKEVTAEHPSAEIKANISVTKAEKHMESQKNEDTASMLSRTHRNSLVSRYSGDWDKRQNMYYSLQSLSDRVKRMEAKALAYAKEYDQITQEAETLNEANKIAMKHLDERKGTCERLFSTARANSDTLHEAQKLKAWMGAASPEESFKLDQYRVSDHRQLGLSLQAPDSGSQTNSYYTAASSTKTRRESKKLPRSRSIFEAFPNNASFDNFSDETFSTYSKEAPHISDGYTYSLRGIPVDTSAAQANDSFNKLLNSLIKDPSQFMEAVQFMERQNFFVLQALEGAQESCNDVKLRFGQAKASLDAKMAFINSAQADTRSKILQEKARQEILKKKLEVLRGAQCEESLAQILSKASGIVSMENKQERQRGDLIGILRSIESQINYLFDNIDKNSGIASRLLRGKHRKRIEAQRGEQKA